MLPSMRRRRRISKLLAQVATVCLVIGAATVLIGGSSPIPHRMGFGPGDMHGAGFVILGLTLMAFAEKIQRNH